MTAIQVEMIRMVVMIPGILCPMVVAVAGAIFGSKNSDNRA